ncbi:hypothetical protein FJ656_31180, partial [Schumannella luteola]
MIAACLIVAGLGLAAAPWAIVAVRRLGGRLGATLVFASALTVLLLASMISGAAPVSLAAAMVTVALLSITSGTAVLVRSGRTRRSRRPGRWLEWVAAGLGGVAWLVALGVASAVPGAVRVGWVLAGDGFNNIELARLLADADGPFTGPDLNPAPLPALLLAVLGGAAGTTGDAVVVL